MRRLLAITTLLLTCAVLLGSAGSASAQPPPSTFGVIPIQQMTPAEIAKAGAGNIGVLRIPVIWQFVEPSPGQYDFAQLDYYVGQAAQNGMEILPFVYTSPSWAVTGCTGLNCQNVPPLDTPAARDAFQNFLRTLVTRYGPGGTFFQENPGIPEVSIRQWQCWNEPSSPYYFKNPNATRYADLVQLCHQAVTSVDPDARSILAGLFGNPKESKGGDKNVIWKFLSRLYAVPGISASFDAVSVHPYSEKTGQLKKVMNKTLNVINRAGDAGVPIYVTEIGAGSGKPKENRPLLRGKGGQARLLKQQFNFLINNGPKYGIGNITWYAWKDPDHNIGNCKFCNTAGLFKENGAPKPAWNALVQITGGIP
jgi:polysaccharide biosynthesis protein PslG